METKFHLQMHASLAWSGHAASSQISNPPTRGMLEGFMTTSIIMQHCFSLSVNQQLASEIYQGASQLPWGQTACVAGSEGEGRKAERPGPSK